MTTRIRHMLLLAIIGIVSLFAATAIGADHQDINFQGRLTDPGGSPVANGTYSLIFSIWDDSTGGTQWWSQMQDVQITSGLFNTVFDNPFAFLFVTDAPAPTGPFFIQTQVEGDSPMDPRIRVSSVYGSILTQRIDGDVITSPGRLEMIPNGPPVSDCTYVPIELAVDSSISRIRIRPFDFSVDCTYVPLELVADPNITRLRLQPPDPVHPVDSTAPAMSMSVDPSQAIYEIMGVEPEPFNVANIALKSDGLGTSMMLQHPGGGNSSFQSMSVDPTGFIYEAMGVEPEPFLGANVRLKSDASNTSLMMSQSDGSREPVVSMSVDPTQFIYEVMGVEPQPFNDANVMLSASAAKTSLMLTHGAMTPGDNEPRVNLGTNGAGADLWLGNTDPGGATAWPFLSTHTNAGVQMNLGFSSVAPPDDGLPASDGNLPGLMLMADASMGSLMLQGPLVGAGNVKRISMTADGTEARVGINTDAPTSALYVNGDIVATGTITEISDARLKSNIREIDDAMAIVQRLRGVKFQWRRDQEVSAELPRGERVGLLAQDVEAVLPEAVLSPEDGYKSVDYSRLTPVLIEALKEQQRQIDELKAMVDQLTKRTAMASDESR